MRTISKPAAPAAIRPTALNCALPAKTKTDSACVSTSERPAARAVMAKATPNGTTPSHSGASAQNPRPKAPCVEVPSIVRSYGRRSCPLKQKRPWLRLPGRFRFSVGSPSPTVTAEARDSAAQARDSFLLPPFGSVRPLLRNLAWAAVLGRRDCRGPVRESQVARSSDLRYSFLHLADRVSLPENYHVREPRLTLRREAATR